jgi:hypothetical protein
VAFLPALIKRKSEATLAIDKNSFLNTLRHPVPVEIINSYIIVTVQDQIKLEKELRLLFHLP